MSCRTLADKQPRHNRRTYSQACPSQEGCKSPPQFSCAVMWANNQVQDIVVGTKSLTDVAKPSEIVSLFMDDEELAESVAKRKQAEAHGYVAPTINQKKGLGELQIEGEGGDDEDDFFSLKRKVANGEDEEVDVPAPSAAGGSGEAGKAKKSKRKAEGEREFYPSFPNIPYGVAGMYL
jgi:hypothetical protein